MGVGFGLCRRTICVGFMTEIYGIRNCDTMKKAMAWLEAHGVAYTFHDYKKAGADEPVLKKSFAAHGWEKTINRAGTTWRALPDNVRTCANENSVFKLAVENPSLIKRPLLVHNGKIHLGFKDEEYAKIFKA
jgi:arsenate reductase